MKYLLLQIAFFACISLLPTCAQTLYTFSNTATATINSTSTTTRTIAVSGVPTSGMVLRQVNISFGDGSSLYSGDMSGFTFKLKDPSNNEINLLTPANSFTTSGSASSAHKNFNIRFRDHAALKTPKAQAAATGSVLGKGYPFNYGYYRPEGAFSSFNTTSVVNGIWTFSVSGYSTTYGRTFNSIQLVFGPPIAVTDIRSSSTNRTCATKACLQTGSIYWAQNTGAGTGQSGAPANTVGGCTWNASQDNMIWFYFVASQTTADVSISGFSTVQESIVVKAPSCGSYTLATGGCPTTLFNGSISHSQKYYDGSWASGYAWNHGYSLTGLTVGEMYMFVIDGSAASNSEYYVELLSGASNGCSPLPIKLLDFSAKPAGNAVDIQWETATERDNDFFTILRSADLVNWEEIGEIPGSGNTNYKMVYGFTDADPIPGTSYYQLKQTDFNGVYEDFDPVSVYLEHQHQGNAVAVYPNPAAGAFELKIRSKGEEASVQVKDLSGKAVIEKHVKLMPGSDKVKLDGTLLQKGVYVVNVVFADGGFCATKLVIE